ncbi:MAG TPA: hypothetical protein VEH49_02725 [Methylomirabilota bacterium]|nr:hypothetical protein [Methylomirabilota bacterium]
MPEPPSPQDTRSKTVVAYLDGRRLKGYVYNFSPANDRFKLFPRDDAPNSRGTEVHIKDLKAVFFVKDFIGDPAYKESQWVDPSRMGRRIEVTFADGETIKGTTDAYNPLKPGFFISPADPECNTLRVFVVRRNARQVRLG